MTRSNTCEACRSVFFPHAYESPKRFMGRRFCSKRCAATARGPVFALRYRFCACGAIYLMTAPTQLVCDDCRREHKREYCRKLAAIRRARRTAKAAGQTLPMKERLVENETSLMYSS